MAQKTNNQLCNKTKKKKGSKFITSIALIALLVDYFKVQTNKHNTITSPGLR